MIYKKNFGQQLWLNSVECTPKEFTAYSVVYLIGYLMDLPVLSGQLVEEVGKVLGLSPSFFYMSTSQFPMFNYG